MHQYADKEKKAAENNRTGIPIQLKRQVEQNSGFSLDDVRVHYDSREPSKLDALAYTRGSQVYIGPGQEHHLPHELGHVVQQKLGIVKPDERHYTGVQMNTDPALEAQADRIGAGRETIGDGPIRKFGQSDPQHPDDNPAQWDFGPFLPLGHTAGASEQTPAQRKVGLEFQTYKEEWNIMELKEGVIQKDFEDGIKSGKSKKDIYKMLEISKDRIPLHKDVMGFDVTIDGPDLEYITEAFDERTDEGKRDLWIAAYFAGDMHKKIPYSMPKYAQEEIGDYYRVKAKGNGKVYYINKNGQQTAHPQATVGVEYEKIPDLMERIAGAKKGDILYQNVPTARESRRQLKESREKVDEFLTETGAIENKDRCRAFLLLAQEYLMAASEWHEKVIGSLEKGVRLISDFRNAVEEEARKVLEMETFEKSRTNTGRLRRLCRYAGLFMGREGEEEGLEIQRQRNELLAERNVILEINDEKERKAQWDAWMTKWEDSCEKVNGFFRRVRLAASLHTMMLPASFELEFMEDDVKSLHKPRLQSSMDFIYSLQLEDLEDTVQMCREEMDTMIKDLKKYWNGHMDLGKCEAIKEKYDALDRFHLVWFQRYFKTLLSVKSRTSFFDLYHKLSPKDRKAVFQYLDSQGHLLISEDWDPHPQGEGTHLDAISYDRWKKGMKSYRRDLANYELEEGNPGRTIFKRKFHVKTSMDIGHDRQNDSGQKENIDGALLELRKLEGGVPPDKWGAVANNICDLIRDIHRPPVVTS